MEEDKEEGGNVTCNWVGTRVYSRRDVVEEIIGTSKKETRKAGDHFSNIM